MKLPDTDLHKKWLTHVAMLFLDNGRWKVGKNALLGLVGMASSVHSRDPRGKTDRFSKWNDSVNHWHICTRPAGWTFKTEPDWNNTLCGSSRPTAFRVQLRCLNGHFRDSSPICKITIETKKNYYSSLIYWISIEFIYLSKILNLFLYIMEFHI